MAGGVTAKTRTKVNFNRDAVYRCLDIDPRANEYVRAKAEEIKRVAIAYFESVQVSDNEWRLSETTPPKYVASFKLRRIKTVRAFKWRVINDDPGALFVEYGAHAGGRTFVLRYKPMTRALDIVAASS